MPKFLENFSNSSFCLKGLQKYSTTLRALNNKFRKIDYNTDSIKFNNRGSSTNKESNYLQILDSKPTEWSTEPKYLTLYNNSKVDLSIEPYSIQRGKISNESNVFPLKLEFSKTVPSLSVYLSFSKAPTLKEYDLLFKGELSCFIDDTRYKILQFKYLKFMIVNKEASIDLTLTATFYGKKKIKSYEVKKAPSVQVCDVEKLLEPKRSKKIPKLKKLSRHRMTKSDTQLTEKDIESLNYSRQNHNIRNNIRLAGTYGTNYKERISILKGKKYDLR